MSNTNCLVQGCKTTIYNKGPGVSFFQCPTSKAMRSKWLTILKNKCSVIDWSRSKICSRHFEHRYFNPQRKLKENAIPTLFPISIVQKAHNQPAPRSKVDKLINRLSQGELISDIKSSQNKMKEPVNLSDFVTDELKCRHDAPMEAKLWLMIKKQDQLITKLMEVATKQKKNLEILQKDMDEVKSSKKELERSTETYRYIIKCLQEKHATLEEQVEILTAVESK